jgi:hypothetical protein
MKQYQEIRGTEPLELKKLNDQLRLLWSKVTHINEKDINPGVINEIHFDSEVSDTLSLARLTAVELEAEKAKIADLEANKASIEQLDVERARIELLESKKASIEQLDVERARITYLESSKADIDDLTAQIGRIDDLYSNVGNINTVLSQSVFAELAEIGEIRAGSAIIADGAIGSSQISSLSVDKLEAGDISTAKFRVIGSNGRLQIQDNLLQVFDGTGTLFERIALGDINNDGSVYGLRIRGADGTTILFDENGQTKEGFTDGYNKLDNNSLDPAKIDIDKVITRINEDGSETFKASKILLDNETLDVKFSTVVTDLANQGQEISNHTAQITALNGAIALKLDSQDFETYTSALDGEIQTITTNLSKATTDIAALQGEIVLKVEQTDIETAKALLRDEISVVDTKIDTKAAELNVTLNGISARVESTESSLNEKVNKASLISEINLSPEEIQINANRVKIGAGTTFEQGQIYTWEQYLGKTWNQMNS